jgi:hypothetical protein
MWNGSAHFPETLFCSDTDGGLDAVTVEFVQTMDGSACDRRKQRLLRPKIGQRRRGVKGILQNLLQKTVQCCINDTDLHQSPRWGAECYIGNSGDEALKGSDFGPSKPLLVNIAAIHEKPVQGTLLRRPRTALCCERLLHTRPDPPLGLHRQADVARLAGQSILATQTLFQVELVDEERVDVFALGSDAVN